jgi:hypothetical protein
MVGIFLDSHMPRFQYAGIHVDAGWLVKLEVEINFWSMGPLGHYSWGSSFRRFVDRWLSVLASGVKALTRCDNACCSRRYAIAKGWSMYEMR